MAAEIRGCSEVDPNAPLEIAPFRPLMWRALGRWIIGCLWPHITIFMAVTVVHWFLVLPVWTTMRTLSWGRVLWIHLVNCAGIVPHYGSVELLYQVKRMQGTRFKYTCKFPSDVFWFKSQTIDNFLRTFPISLPLDRWFGTPRTDSAASPARASSGGLGVGPAVGFVNRLLVTGTIIRSLIVTIGTMFGVMA